MAKPPVPLLTVLEAQAKAEFTLAVSDLEAAKSRAVEVLSQAFAAELQRLKQHYHQVLRSLQELRDGCEDYPVELRERLAKLHYETESIPIPSILRAMTLDCSVELTQVVAQSCKRGEAALSQLLCLVLLPDCQSLAYNKQLRTIQTLSTSTHYPDLQFAYYQVLNPLSAYTDHLFQLKKQLENALLDAIETRKGQLSSLLTEDCASLVAFSRSKMLAAKELWASEKQQQAVELMEKLVRFLRPLSRSRNTVEVFMRLAESYGDSEENFPVVEMLYKEVLALMEETPGRQEEIAEIHRRWGIHMESQGKVREALTVLRKAMSLAPSNEAIVNTLQAVAQNKVKVELCVPPFDPTSHPQVVCEPDPTPGLRQLRAAELYLEVGDSQQAEASLKAAVSCFQGRFTKITMTVFHKLIDLYKAGSHFEEMESYLTMWLESVKTVAGNESLLGEISLVYAEVYLMTGNWDLALKSANEALQLATDDAVKAQACILLSDVCKEQRAFAEGVDWLRQACTLQLGVSPSSSALGSIWFKLASLYYEQADTSAAEDNYRQAADHLIRFDPSSQWLPAALKGLIKVCIQQHKWAEAEQAFDQLMKLLTNPLEKEFIELWMERAELNDQHLARKDMARGGYFAAFESAILLKDLELATKLMFQLESYDLSTDFMRLEGCYHKLLTTFPERPLALTEHCHAYSGVLQIQRNAMEVGYSSLNAAIEIRRSNWGDSWECGQAMTWIAIGLMKQKQFEQAEAKLMEMQELMQQLGEEEKMQTFLAEYKAQLDFVEMVEQILRDEARQAEEFRKKMRW